MDEYIERSEAIEFIKHNTPNINGETTVKCVVRSLKNVPAADVAEVKYGEWVYGHYDIPHCSECGTEIKRGMISPYCPCCGARMDGEGE